MSENAVAERNDTSVVTYEANGEQIKLSPSMIKKYLVSGNGRITDQEAVMFMTLCKYQGLNPFIRDAYCIKYSDREPATMVVGKDVYTKRAERNPKYKGMENGIIVVNKDGQMEERKGSFYMKGEEIVGGWAKIYIDGREVPQYDSVAFDEYAGRKKDGSLNTNWKNKPGTMIEKVAIMHALRNAFPNDFQGLYVAEEMGLESIPEEKHIDVKELKEAVAEEVEENANKEEFVVDAEPVEVVENEVENC